MEMEKKGKLQEIRGWNGRKKILYFLNLFKKKQSLKLSMDQTVQSLLGMCKRV